MNLYFDCLNLGGEYIIFSEMRLWIHLYIGDNDSLLLFHYITYSYCRTGSRCPEMGFLEQVSNLEIWSTTISVLFFTAVQATQVGTEPSRGAAWARGLKRWASEPEIAGSIPATPTVLTQAGFPVVGSAVTTDSTDEEFDLFCLKKVL